MDWLVHPPPSPSPTPGRRPSKMHNSLIHKDEQHLGLPPYSWSPTLLLLCTRVGYHVHTQMYVPLYSQSRHNQIKKDWPYSISSGSTHGIVMITNYWSLKVVNNVCPYLLALIHFFILKSFITTKREYKVIFMLCNLIEEKIYQPNLAYRNCKPSTQHILLNNVFNAFMFSFC